MKGNAFMDVIPNKFADFIILIWEEVDEPLGIIVESGVWAHLHNFSLEGFSLRLIYWAFHNKTRESRRRTVEKDASTWAMWN